MPRPVGSHSGRSVAARLPALEASGPGQAALACANPLGPVESEETVEGTVPKPSGYGCESGLPKMIDMPDASASNEKPVNVGASSAACPQTARGVARSTNPATSTTMALRRPRPDRVE